MTEAGPAGAAAGPAWPGEAAWIDGRSGPIEQAKISVLDLGVTRSDCTYDVMHVREGRFFRLDAHLDRFTASMARLRLDPEYDYAQIDGQPVGAGQPGPLTRQLRDRYWASHARCAVCHPGSVRRAGVMTRCFAVEC